MQFVWSVKDSNSLQCFICSDFILGANMVFHSLAFCFVPEAVVKNLSLKGEGFNSMRVRSG